jgi:hypothetical protein
MDEVKKAIYKMKNDKAVGTTGVTSNMLKILPEKALGCPTGVIQKKWK